MKRYRIEGQEYLAASADAAYAEHTQGWRCVGNLEGGFSPAVPVFVEHPERDFSALDLGTLTKGEEWVAEDLFGAHVDEKLPLFSTEREEQLLGALEAKEEEINQIKELWSDLYWMLTGSQEAPPFEAAAIVGLWDQLTGEYYSYGRVSKQSTFCRPLAVKHVGRALKDGDV